MIGLTTLYFAAELGTSLVTHSLALEAEAFHVLSDLLALITGYYAQQCAKAKPSDTATFGLARAEVLGQ
jgi:Co/Zn/Cd efflux system component